MLQHPQRRHSSLPEEGIGRQRTLHPERRRPVGFVKIQLLYFRFLILFCAIICLITVCPAFAADWMFFFWMTLFVYDVYVGLRSHVVRPDISLSLQARPITSICLHVSWLKIFLEQATKTWTHFFLTTQKDQSIYVIKGIQAVFMHSLFVFY